MNGTPSINAATWRRRHRWRHHRPIDLTCHFWLRAADATDAAPFVVAIRPIEPSVRLGAPFAALCRISCTGSPAGHAGTELRFPMAEHRTPTGEAGPALLSLVDRVTIDGQLSLGDVRVVRIECIALQPGTPVLDTWRIGVRMNEGTTFSVLANIEVEVEAAACRRLHANAFGSSCVGPRNSLGGSLISFSSLLHSTSAK